MLISLSSSGSMSRIFSASLSSRASSLFARRFIDSNVSALRGPDAEAQPLTAALQRFWLQADRANNTMCITDSQREAEMPMIFDVRYSREMRGRL